MALLRVGATGCSTTMTYDDLGPGASIAICDFNHGNPGLAGGGMLANEFIRLPYQFMGLVPPWIPRWGPEHKEFVRTAFKRTIVDQGPGAGDAGLRCARTSGPESEGLLGNPCRAALRLRATRTLSKSRASSPARPKRG